MSSLLVGVIETSELPSAIGWQALAEPVLAWDSSPPESIAADIDQLEADLVAEWQGLCDRLGNQD